VGNITTGGSGKTPLVMHLAKSVLKMGKIPGIVSRGYGRASKGLVVVHDGKVVKTDVETAGDEPFLMASLLKSVPVVVCEKRCTAINHIITQCQVDVIIMDDGFQHRSVKRDVDIITVSANDRAADYHLLPWGKLREPLKNMNRADVAVITKTDNFTPPITLPKIQPFFKSPPLFSREKVTLMHYTEAGYKKSLPPEKTVFAFCGIGEPDSFFRTLNGLKLKLGGKRIFKDHQKYNPAVITELTTQIQTSSCNAIITTEKDLVKLPDDFFEKYKVYVVKLEVEMRENEVLTETIQSLIRSMA